jgi:hypothetical protein
MLGDRRSRLLCNIVLVRDATLDGFGLADVPEDLVGPHLSKGQLVSGPSRMVVTLGWMLSLLSQRPSVLTRVRTGRRRFALSHQLRGVVEAILGLDTSAIAAPLDV